MACDGESTDQCRRECVLWQLSPMQLYVGQLAGIDLPKSLLARVVQEVIAKEKKSS